MDRSWTSQVRKGLVELTVLAALRDGEAYGYEILKRLGRDPLLATTESTLYPILGRLGEDGMVAVRQAPSPAGPPRRYYRLTPAGRAHLADLAHHWHQLRRAVDGLLTEPSNGGHPCPTPNGTTATPGDGSTPTSTRSNDG